MRSLTQIKKSKTSYSGKQPLHDKEIKDTTQSIKLQEAHTKGKYKPCSFVLLVVFFI